jgi:N-acetylglutamate synthase-like GNAT family acetyltransferase
MNGYLIRPAEQGDSQALQDLLAATSQQGSIQLTFERNPNYFYAAQVSTEHPEIWVMDKKDRGVIATFSIGQRRAFINGKTQSIRYGSDLRVHPDFQGGRTLFRLFGQYKKCMKNDWMQTVILDENKASLTTVGSGRSILPNYIPAGKFTTYLISMSRAKKTSPDPQVTRATEEDIEEMQSFFEREASQKQFFPYYNFSQLAEQNNYYRDMKLSDFFLLKENGQITGITALWDQKSFKQTRITGYSRILSILRPVYNTYARLNGALPLPAVSQLCQYQALHCIVVKDNQAKRFERILKTIRYTLKDADTTALACGFDDRDPLLKVVYKYPGHPLKSRQFIATYLPEDIESLDLTRLHYPEICRL